MGSEEKTVSSNNVYSGKVVKLFVDEVLLPNGNKSKREYIVHSGGSAVLCVNDNKILFVTQFRYAYGKNVLELPAGKVNAGENPLDTARRELEEECGIKASELKLLFTVFPSPGYTNENIYIYEANGFSDSKQNLDDDEFLSSVWIDINKVKEMVHNGEINDGKTLIALLYYFNLYK